MAALYRPGEREKALGLASAAAGLLGNVAGPAIFGQLVDLGFDRAPFIGAVLLTLLAIGLLRAITTPRADSSA